MNRQIDGKIDKNRKMEQLGTKKEMQKRRGQTESDRDTKKR